MAKKKTETLTLEEKRMLIEPGIVELPIRRQCDLLDLSKSTYYYEPTGESSQNLLLMRIIDEIYTKHPFYGKDRITETINRKYKPGFVVNVKRVRRLMRLMGLEAIYAKPNLSKPGKNHTIYPYLLRNVNVLHPDQAWATDITYVRMHNGFLYLVVIMDWYSRYVISWQLSNSMNVDFCIRALEQALETRTPTIFNSDQGSQFTSNIFIRLLKEHRVQISMTGKGRCFDNIFVERLWRSVKQEEVYLNDYMTVLEAEQRIGRYFEFYNKERFHQSLDYETPFDVYTKGLTL